MSRCLLLLLFCFAVPLSGACKEGTGGASGATAALQDAARKSSADTARVTIGFKASHPEAGEFLSLAAEGEVDFKAGSSRLTVASEPAVEQIYADGRSYQAWPNSPYWVVAAEEPGPLLGLNPVTMLEQLARAHDVQHLGQENIDGAQADHYRFSVTGDDFPERLRSTLQGMAGTVDVWLSNDRVHRVITVQEFGPDAYGDLAGQEMVTEVRLFDWGIKLQISPPDPSLIKTFEELGQRTR